jgi:hypothetical protein
VPNEIAFDLFRGLQGLVSSLNLDLKLVHLNANDSQGAAANVPTAIGILGTTFPPGKAKTYAFSVYGKLV